MLTVLVSTVRLAIQNLSLNQFRSFLAMLGIVWGIASVTILIAIVTGFYQNILEQWEEMGMNMLVLDYAPTFEKDGTRYALRADEQDAVFLESENPYVKLAAPAIRRYEEIQVGEKTEHFGIMATSPKFAVLMNLKPDYGRFITEIDYEYERKVAVIGARVKETLFKELDEKKALGQTIFIRGNAFKVVGVFDRRRTVVDWLVYIPLTTYKRVLKGSGFGRTSLTIYASLSNIKDFEKGKVYAIRLLSAKYGFDPNDETAIRVRDYAQWRKRGLKIFYMFFGLFYTIGIMTLAVGAIGVANVMLVAVQERTREIGLRKAVGATSSTIMFQFVSEAMIICLVGGVFGIVLGMLLIGILRQLPLPEQFPPPIITAPSIYIATAVDIIVGLLAAYYPAKRASELDPIEALRFQ